MVEGKRIRNLEITNMNILVCKRSNTTDDNELITML